MIRRFVSNVLRLGRPKGQSVKYLSLFDSPTDLSNRLSVSENFVKTFQISIHGSTEQIEIGHYWNPRTSYIVEDCVLNTKFGLVFKNGQILGDFNPREGSAQDSAAINRARSKSVKLKRLGAPNQSVYFINSLGGNYAHWIIEELPKIMFVLENYPNVQFFSSNDLPDFSLEILSILSILPTVISEPVVSVNEIILIDSCDVLWPHPVDLDRVISLSKRLTCGADLNHKHPLIYISRKKSSRSLEDESKLENYLVSRGFEVLHAEDLDFYEKLRQFSECEILIAPFGAGLTNLIFTPSKSLIIELASPSYWAPDYQVLSQLTNHRHVTVGLQATPKSNFGSAPEAIEKISQILDIELKNQLSEKKYL